MSSSPSHFTKPEDPREMFKIFIRIFTKALGPRRMVKVRERMAQDPGVVMELTEETIIYFKKEMFRGNKEVVEDFINFLKMMSKIKSRTIPSSILSAQNVSELVSVFHNAIHAGHTEQIKTFIEVAPSLGCNAIDLINSANGKTGSTALHVFTKRQNKEFVQYLLANGANPNQVNGFAKTPLLIACENRDPEMVNILIKSNADLNFRVAMEDNATVFSLSIITFKHYDQITKLLLEILLSAKPDINAQDTKGYTPLIDAVGAAAVEVLALLLKIPGININHQDKEGATALTFATNAQSLEKMKLLLKAGADPNIGNIITSPLFTCVDKNFVQGSKLLLETGKVDVNREFQEGNTLLIKITLHEQLETMRQLFAIYPHVQVNCKNEKGTTALTTAVKQAHLPSVEFLLEKGADPTVILQPHTFTLLHIAANYGLDKVLNFLLRNPLLLKMIDAVDSEGNTALLHAVLNHHVACTKLLLENGASLSVKDTPYGLLIWAAKIGNSELVALLLHYQPEQAYDALIEAFKVGDEKSVKILIESGHIDMNDRDENNATLLHIALRVSNNPKIIELLLQAGLDPNAFENRSLTPLHIAAYHGFAESIPILLAADAHINAVTDSNETPLLHAAINKQIESVKMLLKFKADPHIRAKRNNKLTNNTSAIEVTLSAEIVQLLRASGCKDRPYYCYTNTFFLSMEDEFVLNHFIPNTFSSLVPALDWNENIGCGRLDLNLKLYVFFNELSKEKRHRLLKLFLAEKLKTESITKDSIHFAVDLLVATCSDFCFLEDFGLGLKFIRQKTQQLISTDISLQNFIDGLKQLKVEKEVTDKQISAFSEILWSFSHEGQLGRIKDTFLSLQEKTLNTFNKTIELCQRDLTTIQQLEREYHQYSLESHHKDLQKDCQTLFSEVKALKERFSSQDLKVTDFTKDLAKEYEELSKRFEKLNEFLKRYNEKITPSITLMKEKLVEKQEKKSNIPTGKAKTKKRGRKKHVEMSVSHGQNTTIASAPSKEKQEKTNLISSEIQKNLQELQEVLVSAPKQPVVTFRQEPTKLSPEILAQVQMIATAFQPLSLKQSFASARGPQPHTLSAVTQLPDRLRAIEGREILQKTSQQAKLTQTKAISGIELLIQTTAMKGALAQALESRNGLDEGWPNKIRNLIFHHEYALDKCPQWELIKRIEYFNQNLESIKENDLIKDKEKLTLEELDVDDFFSHLLKQKLKELSQDALQKEIVRSERELDSFKIYIQERKLDALKNANLKMAVGFSLARIGTSWNKLPRKLRENSTCPYSDCVVFGKEYRHVDKEWVSKVNSFIKRCLADAPSAVKPKEAQAQPSSSVGSFGGGFGLETKVRHEQHQQYEQYGQQGHPLTFSFGQDYGQPIPFTQPAMSGFVAGPRVLDISSDAGDRKKAS